MHQNGSWRGFAQQYSQIQLMSYTHAATANYCRPLISVYFQQTLKLRVAACIAPTFRSPEGQALEATVTHISTLKLVTPLCGCKKLLQECGFFYQFYNFTQAELWKSSNVAIKFELLNSVVAQITHKGLLLNVHTLIDLPSQHKLNNKMKEFL